MAEQKKVLGIGWRKWTTGMTLILAALILPFFREFPMEQQLLWGGITICVGGNIFDHFKKKD